MAASFAAKHPERFAQLLRALEWGACGVDQAPTVAEACPDADALADQLFSHFESNEGGKPFRPIAWCGFHSYSVDAMRKDDTFCFWGKTGKMARRLDGYLDWGRLPDNISDAQFIHALTRMCHIFNFLAAHKQRSDPSFVNFVYVHMEDFVLANPVPDEAPPVGTLSAWCTLDTAIRAETFCKLFYTLLQVEPRDNERLLLLLSSVIEHGNYLHNHCGHGDNNWANTEMKELLNIAVHFPELKTSKTWAEHGINRFFEITSSAIYPDGAQAELAIEYGLHCFSNTVDAYKKLKEGGFSCPSSLYQSAVSQTKFYAHISKPDGRIMAHGDSDNRTVPRDSIIKAALLLNVPEALYVASNGCRGLETPGPPSRFFDWSGFAISRSGYTTNSQWSAFNVGPIGIAHIHPDQLAIEVYNGRDILVDPGRYTYDWAGGWAPNYFQCTRGHNTLMIDGNQQACPSSKEHDKSDYFMRSSEPLGVEEAYEITDDYDNFRGRTYSGYKRGTVYGPRVDKVTIHERAVHYRRGKFWAIVDRVTSDRPRHLTAFWHFHPHCETVKDLGSGAVATLDADKGNLLILPMRGGNASFAVTMHKGESSPWIQGWYSETMNQKVESYDLKYSADGPAQSHFGWLLVPFTGDHVPDVSAKLHMMGDTASVGVEVDGECFMCTLTFNTRASV